MWNWWITCMLPFIVIITIKLSGDWWSTICHNVKRKQVYICRLRKKIAVEEETEANTRPCHRKEKKKAVEMGTKTDVDRWIARSGDLIYPSCCWNFEFWTMFWVQGWTVEIDSSVGLICGLWQRALWLHACMRGSISIWCPSNEVVNAWRASSIVSSITKFGLFAPLPGMRRGCLHSRDGAACLPVRSLVHHVYCSCVWDSLCAFCW
jgi:hypothetical protein